LAMWYIVDGLQPTIAATVVRGVLASNVLVTAALRRSENLAGLSQMRWCFSHAAGFLSACGASSRLDERIPGIQRSS
jgi:hypothetical protein